MTISSGKPAQNAFIESINSRVRAELLKAHWFRSLLNARNAADAWRHAYPTIHSHSALGYMNARGVPRNLRNYARPQK